MTKRLSKKQQFSKDVECLDELDKVELHVRRAISDIDLFEAGHEHKLKDAKGWLGHVVWRIGHVRMLIDTDGEGYDK